MAILIAICVIQLVIIYFFSFDNMDKDYYIKKLELEKRLLMQEKKYIIELLGKKEK